mmetsp:Transcript_20886/g.63671  ORF Transcript_20886/g.63671 Transcript_20886/m.63671 type:complete len:146 (-) Transcript_20886:530-967(-)
MMGRNSALCAAGGDGDDDGAGASADDTDIIEELMEKYGPAGGQLSFGWFCGLVSGYALKRIGQKVAFGLGVVFLVAQGLAYSGFIDIKWNKVRDAAIAKVDLDGDGKITKNDLKILWRRLKDVLTYNLPAGGGFMSGIACGVYFM